MGKDKAEREDYKAERVKKAYEAARRKSEEREAKFRQIPYKRPQHEKEFIYDRESQRYAEAHPGEPSPFDNTRNLKAEVVEARTEEHNAKLRIKESFRDENMPKTGNSDPDSTGSRWSLDAEERKHSREVSGEVLKKLPDPLSTGERVGMAAANILDRMKPRKDSADSDLSFFGDAPPDDSMEPCQICGARSKVLHRSKYCDACWAKRK